MTKRLEVYIILALCLLAFGCATIQSYLTHPETFDVSIGGNTYSMVLPQDIPSMKNAVYGGEMCWEGLLCRLSYCLDNANPEHEHVIFWYMPGEKPLAIIWAKKDGEYLGWLYVKDIPIPASLEKLDEFLDGMVNLGKELDTRYY